MSLYILSTHDNITQATIIQHFDPIPDGNDENFYDKFQLRLRQLRNHIDLLHRLLPTRSNIILCLSYHKAIPSNQTIIEMLHNLGRLEQTIVELKSSTERLLFNILDLFPQNTAMILRSLIKVRYLLETLSLS